MYFRITPELLTVRNNPSAVHWNVENGYQLNVNESEVYPYRVFGAGFDDSLQTLAKIAFDMSFKECGYMSPGFLVSLHMPDELPQFPNNYIFIPMDQNVLISIIPKIIYTSNGLRSYAVHERGCFFKSERPLRFFKSYSQQKCELECLTNYTQEVCGCVRFYAPSE